MQNQRHSSLVNKLKAMIDREEIYRFISGSIMGLHSHYPEVQSRTWSIDRLIHALDKNEPLPHRICVGGRLRGNKIFSAAGEINWPQVPTGHGEQQVNTNEKNENLVTIEFLLPDLKKIGPRQFHVEKIIHIQTYFDQKHTNFLQKKIISNDEQQIEDRAAPTSGNDTKWSADVARKWAHFLASTRNHFASRGLLEMTTPSLVRNPGMEPELEPFSTQWRSGSQKRQLFLPTSPELHLKQLMTQGFHDIFEVKTVFRNEELTEFHEAEFQMIEWYRAFSNLDLIMEDLESYLQLLMTDPIFNSAALFASDEKLKVVQYTVSHFFADILDFHLTPETTKEELYQLAEKKGLHPNKQSTWNDLFHLIWVSLIDTRLPRQPFLLRDYPPSQAALSRINSRGWADRFEFYWAGVEIANAFHELNDPIEQRKRFERDQQLRVQNGKTPLEIDENFMRALEYGLPPSAGIALGLDRLFMVLTGQRKIGDTRAFGLRHQFI